MVDLMSLEDKTIVLTGATGYIGRYFAESLIDAEARVILVGRNEEKLNQLEGSLRGRQYGAEASYYVLDQYDRHASHVCYEEILREERCVDVLINNAWDFSKKTGFNDPSGHLENATFDQLQASFESGVWWAIQSTQVFGGAMKKQGHGSIINIGTMYATVVPSPHLYEGTDKFNPPGYSMAKAALLQFTRYSASFLAPHVRVNMLSPGAIPNVESESANATTDDDPVLTRLKKEKILLKRVGHPSDLTGQLVFLASDASMYTTGQNFIIDGGLTVT